MRKAMKGVWYVEPVPYVEPWYVEPALYVELEVCPHVQSFSSSVILTTQIQMRQ
jgi:hypothetical protein